MKNSEEKTDLSEAFGLATIKGILIFGSILILSLNQNLNNLIKIFLWFGSFLIYLMIETLIIKYNKLK